MGQGDLQKIFLKNKDKWIPLSKLCKKGGANRQSCMRNLSKMKERGEIIKKRVKVFKGERIFYKYLD